MILDKQVSERWSNVIAKPVFWSTLTGTVVILLAFDGVVHNLPDYDLRKQNTVEVHLFFTAEILISVACQILFLRIVKENYVSKQKAGLLLKSARLLHHLMTAAQFVIIALLLVVVIQVEIQNKYHSLVVAASAVMSIFIAISLTSMLALRFWLWLRFGIDRVVMSYAFAMTITAASLVFLAVFIALEMLHAPMIIDSTRIAVSTSNITNFALIEFNSYLSLASFVSIWIASVFLLSLTKRKQRRATFYLIVMLPLLYYLGIFQWIVSYLFSSFGLLNAVQDYTFDLLNSILTRPIGGILFGIAFWTVARGAKEINVSDHMKLAAFGIVLLSISNVDAGLFMLPYPSFGLPTISFMSLSSYLLFLGIYYSAISVSLDQKLRTSIQKSVEQQLRFVSKIGVSQMEREVQKKVARITKDLADELQEESGVETSIPDNIEGYISTVIEETKKLQVRKNDPSDRNISNK